MTPYHQFLENLARAVNDAQKLPLGGFAPILKSQPIADAPRVLIFSPHPDDECVIGGLALRLMRESGMRVVNVAVTQGSNQARQAERWHELTGACDYLGFELVPTGPCGLEKISLKTREQDPQHWAESVRVIFDILAAHRPRVILFPHDRDWNSTHLGSHHLVIDALKQLPRSFECYAVETEFWGQMADPNLMVELSIEDLGHMISALTFHVGEVKRNPYHLNLPAWMMDNVRRAEIVGGQGTAAPEFTFATIYRLRKWSDGQLTRMFEGGRFMSQSQNLAELFR